MAAWSGTEEAISAFQQLLRLRTISEEGPSGAYHEAVDFLTSFATDVGFTSECCRVVEPVEGHPVLLVTWEGTEPHLPKIMLNSHYDVVPVAPDQWDVDPFGGVEAESGKIYGRGAQDMKSVCIQYLAAIRRLREAGFSPRRTVILSFMPDEEVGGANGMLKFLESEAWKELQPVGMALDEGIANPGDEYTVFFGERAVWQVEVVATGPTGHGSRFIPGPATSKLIAMCNKALAYREAQEAELGHSGGCSHANAKKLGDVTTVNITVLKAGHTTDGGKTYTYNSVPAEAMAMFDVRIATTTPIAEFGALMDEWCSQEGVSWRLAPPRPPMYEHYVTSTDREKNPWWGLFSDAVAAAGVPVQAEVFPAATDCRFLRQAGLPAFGFSPMRRTQVLMHDHNEYLHRDVFLEGIAVYELLVTALAGAERLPTEEVAAAAEGEGGGGGEEGC